MYDNLEPEIRDRVSKMMEYWSGTLHTRLLQRALDENDMEAIKYHLREAEAEYSLQEDDYITTMPYMNSALVNLKRRYGSSDDR